MSNENLKRRNLTGMYIFDTFPGEDRQPTCIEDCQPVTRWAWCMTHDMETVRKVIDLVGDKFREVTDLALKHHCIDETTAQQFNKTMDSIIGTSIPNVGIANLADILDIVCKKLILLADSIGVEGNPNPPKGMEKNDNDNSR